MSILVALDLHYFQELLNWWHSPFKYFWFLFRCRDIQMFMHYAYIFSEYRTASFILHIIRVRKFLFCILSVYRQFHSAYYLQTLRFSQNGTHNLHILSMSKISFLVFWLYAKLHSAYSRYESNFIPHIISIRTYFIVLTQTTSFFWDQALILRITYQYAINLIPRIISTGIR
jgi:hypothetical protein